MSLWGNFTGGIGNIASGLGNIVTGNEGKGFGQLLGGAANVGTLGMAGQVYGKINPHLQQYQMSPDQNAFMAAMQKQMSGAQPSQASNQIQNQLLPQAMAQNQALLASSRAGAPAARNTALANAQLQQQGQQQMQQADIASMLQGRAMLGQSYGTALGINTAQDQAAQQQNLLRQQMFAGLLGAAGQGIGAYETASKKYKNQGANYTASPSGDMANFGNPYQDVGMGFTPNYSLPINYGSLSNTGSFI